MAVELIPFDAADFLETNEDVADYLNDMLADGGAFLAQHALGVAVRVAGMMKVCQATGLTRHGINKATRPTSKPSFQTVLSIAQGLGLQLRFVPWRGESACPEPRSSSLPISDILCLADQVRV